jgi:hypothetical protein
LQLPEQQNNKRSQPRKLAAIVVFILLMLPTLLVTYILIVNAVDNHFSILTGPIAFPLYPVAFAINTLSVLTALIFVAKRKLNKANRYLLIGWLLLFCVYWISTH